MRPIRLTIHRHHLPRDGASTLQRIDGGYFVAESLLQAQGMVRQRPVGTKAKIERGPGGVFYISWPRLKPPPLIERKEWWL